MKLTLLGTGSPVPSLKRASAGYMVRTGGDTILIDFGPGCFQRMLEAGVGPIEVSHVFLSHLHFDHCLDLVRLYLNRWDVAPPDTPPLKIFGPPGLRHFLDRLFGPDGAFKADLTARTSHDLSLDIYRRRGGTPPRPWPAAEVTEVAESDVVAGDGWRMTLANVPHVQPYLVSYGIRLEADGGILAYTSDVTVPADQAPVRPLYGLARDADLLVHYLNAFDLPDPDNPRNVPGRTQQQAVAELARDCAVRTLVTSHHGPAIDASGVRERVIADIAAIYDGRLIWGEDLMTFDIGGGTS